MQQNHLNEVLTQTEIPIYGAGKIGVKQMNQSTNEPIYELSDHLGNVRTTFTKGYELSVTTHFDGTGLQDYLFDYTNVNLDVLKDAGGSSISKSVKTDASYTNGRPNTKGPSISIPVTPGQKIDGSIYCLYAGTFSFPYPEIRFVLEQVDAITGQRYFLRGGNLLTLIYTGIGTWTKRTFSTYTVNAYASNMYLTIYPFNNDYSRAVWWDNMSLSITPNIYGEGGIPKPQQESITDYYPHGGIMPGRNTPGAQHYRNGYQGQFAEKDPETGFNSFELRDYDSKLGRWMVPDPMRQYHSPYLGMGNNPVNMVDPNGGNDDIITVNNQGQEISRVAAPGEDIFISTLSTIEVSAYGPIKLGLLEGLDANFGSFKGNNYEKSSLFGQNGFENYVGTIDNAGIFLQSLSPLGKKTPIIGQIGTGLSLTADALNTFADIDQKGINQGLKNSLLRVGAFAVGRGIDKLGKTGFSGLEDASKVMLNVGVDKIKENAIDRSNNNYYKRN